MPRSATRVDKKDAGGPAPSRSNWTVNEPGDRLEREADRFADRVAGGDTPSFTVSSGAGGAQVQRMCAACASGKGLCPSCAQSAARAASGASPAVQTKPLSGASPAVGSSAKGTALDAAVGAGIDGLDGAGSALSEGDRAYFEPRLGQDLSDVRVHTGSAAADLSQSLNAQAFTAGNNIAFAAGRYAPATTSGRHLLAHELAHVSQQRSSAGGSVSRRVQRQPDGGASAVPQDPPYVPDILARSYPHLTSVLKPDQIAGMQKAVNATHKARRLGKKQRSFADRMLITPQGYGGASSDVAQWRKLGTQISAQNAIAQSNRLFSVDSKLLLADDVRNAGVTELSRVVAYHKSLYKRVTEFPILITVHPELADRTSMHDRFLTYSWGQGKWQFGHTGGLIHFYHLMAAQKLRLEYLLALTKDRVEVLGKLVELSRDIGDPAFDPRGHIIGVMPGSLWDTDVKLGFKIGDLGGYYDDGRGRVRMHVDLYSKAAKKKSRAVLKSASGFLHIFETDPRFNVLQLTAESDGYSYIYTSMGDTSLVIDEFITGDGRFLEKGSTRKGKGWRSRTEMTGFEQFAVGAIFGDAFEESTGASIFGQVVFGLIPIVGQIADARDVAVGIKKMWETGGKDGKLQTAFALIGFVPLFGDYLKGVFKPAAKEAGEVALKAAKVEAVAKTVKEVGQATEEKAGKKLLAAAREGGQEGAVDAVRKTGVAETFVKGVKRAADEAAGDPATIRLVNRGGTADVAEALGQQLTKVDRPRLITEAPVRLGNVDHVLRVVQRGGWKQLWLCTTCSSLIGRLDDTIEEALKAAKAADPATAAKLHESAEGLRRLRRNAVKAEADFNAGKVGASRTKRRVENLASDLRRLTARTPSAAGLQHLLSQELELLYLKRYGKSSIKELTASERKALSLGYEPTPPGYSWHYAETSGLKVTRESKGLTKKIYDPKSRRFIPDTAARKAEEVFAKGTTPSKAFDLLQSAEKGDAFKQWVEVIRRELGLSKKDLIAGLKDPSDLTHRTIRRLIKSGPDEMLWNRIVDPAVLQKTDVYRSVLKQTKDADKALRAASHSKLLEVSKGLGNADKGALAEKWYARYFAKDKPKFQVKLGAEQGLKKGVLRRIDILHDGVAHEIKNVATSMSTKEASQLDDLMTAIGKKIDAPGGAVKYDRVQFSFMDPAGARVNAGWIARQLEAHAGRPLAIEVFNSRGQSLLLDAVKPARTLEDVVKEITKHLK